MYNVIVKAARDHIKSSKKIKRKKIINTFSLFLLVFLVFFDLFGKISQVDRFLISQIKISGNNIIKTEDILKIAKEELSGRYFMMFPKNNFLIYPKGSIKKAISEKFLRVENISVENNYNSELDIVIEEKEPVFVWSPIKNKGRFYMDKDGLIFSEAPELSPGVFLEIEGGISNNENPLSYMGKKIIDSDKLDKIIKFKNEAEEIVKKEFSPVNYVRSVSLLEWDDLSLNFSGENGHAWNILFVGRGNTPTGLPSSGDGVLKTKQDDTDVDLEASLVSTARNLEVVLSSPSFKSDAAKANSFLDYIDLRFGKKIFYKFSDKKLNSSNEASVVQ